MDKQNLKDHKQIGQELELFFSHEYAPGAPFWLPKGMVIFKELEKYIRNLTENAGYLETSTPIMVKNQLFKESEHWTKFGEHNMYNLSIYESEEITTALLDIKEKEKDIIKKIKEGHLEPFSIPLKISETQNVPATIHPVGSQGEYRWTLDVNYSLKPMNCPESTIIYRFRPRTYKELPLRLSELGRLHRREKSGEVNGLLRVRQITMDDAHIYVREDQIFEEVSGILDMIIEFYENFGFEYEFRFATRPEQKAGNDEMWDKAEKELEEVLKKKNIKASGKKGDGAFYGPKIDMHIKDALGRNWQLATVQLDFHMPQAFDLKYINEKGEYQKPVMIHRAIFGSFERFIGILTEHFQGAFPLWLSPVQVKLIPIADRHVEYAKIIVEKLEEENIRVEIDDRSETMQAKIRLATLQKVPFMGIIGDKEVSAKGRSSSGRENGVISVRTREGKDLGQVKISEFIKDLKEKIDKKV